MLGNGDIFAASDALAMMAQTGCDGVVVGRGCQGRPWLFAELAAAFDGRPAPDPAGPAGRRGILRRHAELLCAGRWGPTAASATCANTSPGTCKGFAVGSEPRRRLGMVSTAWTNWTSCSARLDLDQPFPAAADGPRGRQGSPQRRVALPYGWLDDPESEVVPDGAELDDGGG